MQTASTQTEPAARFGATHGYRFVADEVELHATFVIANAAAHSRTWSLQLWACPAVPAGSTELAGHLVAEAPLPPMAEVAGAHEAFTVTAPALPPAGARDHTMVLVLAARRDESAPEVHDLAAYPARERFLLPRFTGPVAHDFGENRVSVLVAGIENPRPPGTLSGTLAFELWALPAPYEGGAFVGAALAGTALGMLGGGAGWVNLRLDLPFDPPPGGPAHVVAMVREWTPAGYVTRDFAELGTFPGSPAATETPAPAASPADESPAEPAAPKARPRKSPKGKLSLNTATLEELLAVKNLPRPVAARIVQERPFVEVADVMRVRGMGEKLFVKLRRYLTV